MGIDGIHVGACTGATPGLEATEINLEARLLLRNSAWHILYSSVATRPIKTKYMSDSSLRSFSTFSAAKNPLNLKLLFPRPKDNSEDVAAENILEGCITQISSSVGFELVVISSLVKLYRLS